MSEPFSKVRDEKVFKIETVRDEDFLFHTRLFVSQTISSNKNFDTLSLSCCPSHIDICILYHILSKYNEEKVGDKKEKPKKVIQKLVPKQEKPTAGKESELESKEGS